MTQGSQPDQGRVEFSVVDGDGDRLIVHPDASNGDGGRVLRPEGCRAGVQLVPSRIVRPAHHPQDPRQQETALESGQHTGQAVHDVRRNAEPEAGQALPVGRRRQALADRQDRLGGAHRVQGETWPGRPGLGRCDQVVVAGHREDRPADLLDAVVIPDPAEGRA